VRACGASTQVPAWMRFRRHGSSVSAVCREARRGGGGGGNTTIQQIGVVRRTSINLQSAITFFSHLSQPQANTLLSQTGEMIQSVHTTNTVVQRAADRGIVQYRDYEQYLQENSPSTC